MKIIKHFYACSQIGICLKNNISFVYSKTHSILNDFYFRFNVVITEHYVSLTLTVWCKSIVLYINHKCSMNRILE